MIWNQEVKAVFRAWLEKHITADELVECYSVMQRKAGQSGRDRM